MSKKTVKKVNFFCVGAQKSGTTLLHDILKQHSDIYLPEEKEANFFDVNEYYCKGTDYYLKTYYNNYAGEKIIGNINPNLQVELRSIDRVVESFGNDIKVVVLLRNPVSRAYSHYLMSRKRGYENLEFLDALELERERISNPKLHKDYASLELGHFEKNHFGYVTRSLYAPLLAYLFDKLGRERVKVYIFEEFIRNKDTTIKDILRFLEVESQVLNLDIKSNPAQEAQYYKVSKFLNTYSKPKSLLKMIIPKSIRRPLKSIVYERNLKEISKKENELPYSYKELKRNYFEEDIIRTERLLERKIDNWA